MERKAQAVVFTGIGQVEVRPLRIPELQPDEVLVRSEVTAISVGTDRWMLQGRYQGVTSRYPLVYGYQRVGRIEAVGANVNHRKPGDRVYVGLSGSRLDPADGYGAAGGGYTSHGVVHWSDATPVPEDVPADVAALCGLAAVALEGVQLSRVQAGDLVAVLGLGVIGQCAAQFCRAQGAHVVGTDLLEPRLDLARRYSVDLALNPTQANLAAALAAERQALGQGNWGPPGGDGEPASQYEWQRWQGAGGTTDVVIDTVGSARLVNDHVALLRRQGRLCLQAYFPDTIPLDFHAAHLKRATIITPGGMDLAGYRTALQLAREGSLRLAPLITHRLPAAQAPEAFRLVLEAPDQILGMILTW